MKFLVYIFLVCLIHSCKTDNSRKNEKVLKNTDGIECTEKGCNGKYQGLEFINGEDIAHQFSNKMSNAVGEELKKLYRQEKYRKVNFDSIKMTTEGMGSGNVTYTLSIPFIAVNSKCDAYTSFDHVGGWNHKPDLEKRKIELKNVTLKGHKLEISNLKMTKEGLQEYWIQWKNIEIQSDCE